MSRTKKRSSRVGAAVTLLILAAAGTVALALYVKMTPADKVPQVYGEKGMPAEVKTPPEISNVLIPIPKREGDLLSFESMEVPVKGDKRVSAVNAFLEDSGLIEGVRLENIELDAGRANLHFSEGLTAGEGSMDEATLVYGLRAVLGQFEEIERFEIYEGSVKVEELGHFELGESLAPIPVSRWGDPVGTDRPTSGEAPPPSMPR